MANDGYPAETGKRLLEYLDSPNFVKNLKSGLSHTYEVDKEAADTMREKSKQPYGMSSRHYRFLENPLNQYKPDLLVTHQSLYRRTGVAVLVLIARATMKSPIPLQFEPEFANDGLYCEWAYVIDLDTQVLEVYGGSERKNENHRFHDIGAPGETVPKFLLKVHFSAISNYTHKEDFGVAFQAMAIRIRDLHIVSHKIAEVSDGIGACEPSHGVHHNPIHAQKLPYSDYQQPIPSQPQGQNVQHVMPSANPKAGRKRAGLPRRSARLIARLKEQGKIDHTEATLEDMNDKLWLWCNSEEKQVEGNNPVTCIT
ncbi:hypothetical protein NQ176_g9639 [Zarea fungicola]|uniref:Uncharacterized protein n=1 Tax=Zarea fungicola TaxID=93591 RepID=A0ACC1MKM8_9HYPO|nr:hypothetical protein NQ176_g9639 [Lecanicillium fungicola]